MYGWEEDTEHEAEADAREAWEDDYGQDTDVPSWLWDAPDFGDDDHPDSGFLTIDQMAEAMTA